MASGEHCEAIMNRRGFLLAALAAGALPLGAWARGAFSWDQVIDAARAAAARPWQSPAGALPAALADLDYDAWRDIRFRPGHALWRDQDRPFQVQFFHPGALFNIPVRLHEIVDGRVVDIPYRPDLFTFGPRAAAPEAAPGFAGFRLHYPLNRPDILDELVAFLGASYFRALGRQTLYGLSARGLAIDTGGPDGEEFPAFTEFWLERPAPGQHWLSLYARLDSPRVAGAYRFVIHPGTITGMDITAHLFFRDDIARLGLAPLTGMYAFGENDRVGVDDYRPEVHDCDGLSIHAGSGEWLWRPLGNPGRLRFAHFLDRNPRGFGLLQRDRRFSAYEDTESRYERRPSAWVTPRGDWGAGAVELVEIPTRSEVNDNIVAYWTPEGGVAGGSALEIAYRLDWGLEPPMAPDAARVIATRTGQAGISGSDNQDPDQRKFVVDFAGGLLAGMPDSVPVQAVVTATGGRVRDSICVPLPDHGRRAAFNVTRTTDGPVELRCFLRQGDATLSETWVDQWTS